MVTLRKRVRSEEISANPTRSKEKNPSKKPRVSSSSKGKSKSESEEMASKNYEQARDERIKENKLRMEKLGILALTQKLKSRFESSRPAQKKSQKPKCLPAEPLPRRRSSRLQKVTPVNYAELRPKQGGNFFLEEGSAPEIYTEEHEKLLGTCKMPWELFKDGYGVDGKRIYDQVNGKTCHQCRQKTLGHRTHCSKCNLVQGQFCGDCLYMRYGENVLEANENPVWVCPVCRGICNCSFCRLKKGLAPTGPLYKKISNLGFKSVAHFLIQTRRSMPNSEDPVPILCSSAKRSLQFADSEDMETDSHILDEDRGGNNDISGVASKSRQELKNKQVEEDPSLNEIKIGIKHMARNIWDEDRGGNNDISGVASKSRQELKNKQVEEDPSLNEIKIGVKHMARKPLNPHCKNKQKKAANHAATSQTILESGTKQKSESGLKSPATSEPIASVNIRMASELKTRIKCFASKRVVAKRLSQDDNDAAMASGVKPADVVLLVSQDGMVHFSHGSNPKPVAVPRLSSDGILHFVWESEPEPTAVAPDPCSNNICIGAGGAQASATESESEAEPCTIPQQSSDNAIHVLLHNRPEPVTPATVSSNGICNDELGAKATGIAADGESDRYVETQLYSDGNPSVAASPSTLQPIATSDLSSVAIGNGALEAEASVAAVELNTDVAIPVPLRSKPNTTGPKVLALDGVYSSALGATGIDGVASETESNRDADTRLCLDAIPSVASPSKLKPIAADSDLSSVGVGNDASRAEGLGVAVELNADGAIPAAMQSKPNTTGPQALALDGVCIGALGATDTGGIASESESGRDAGTQRCSDGVPCVASPSRVGPTAASDLSFVGMGNGALGAEESGVAVELSSDDAIPVGLHCSGVLGATDTVVAWESELEPATLPKASSSSGGGIHVALQSELQPPETPEVNKGSTSTGKFGSGGIVTTGQKKKARKTPFVQMPSWNSIAGRLKRRRRSMSS